MEEQTLATELMKELKASATRWFIIAMVELLLILSVCGGFIWYISLPVDEVVVESEDGSANYVGNDLTGAIYNGKSNSAEAASTAP